MSIDIQNLLDQYNTEEVPTTGSYSWTANQLLSINTETGAKTIEYLIENWIHEYPKKNDQRYKAMTLSYRKYTHGIHLDMLKKSREISGESQEVLDEVKTLLSTIFQSGTARKNEEGELAHILGGILEIIRSDLTF